MSARESELPLFRSILVAANFTERSRDAFRVACSLADEQASRLVVLYVMESTPVVEQPVMFGEPGVLITSFRKDDAHRAAVLERLRELYAPVPRLKVEYLTREGDAAEEILRAANELNCDLIVTGTRGSAGLDRLLFGSVAETVVREARCPVVTVRFSMTAAPANSSPERTSSRDVTSVL